jgi:hypothetical protein
MTRCQICGRRLGVLSTGLIRSHHFHGQLCLGSGHAPIEECDFRLEQCATDAGEREEVLRRELAELFERRANYIEPRLYSDLRSATIEANRLGRRLQRHRSWPQRFQRQMETQGWGDPPPAYMAGAVRVAS